MSFVLLGILNAQAAGGGAANAYDFLESVSLTSSASSVNFTNLSSYTDYKHLQIRMVHQKSGFDQISNMNVRINSDTGSNYAYHYLAGESQTLSSNGASSQTSIQLGNSVAEAPDDTFASAIIDITDFASTSKNTVIRAITGAVTDANFATRVASGVHVNTSAMNTIEFFNTTFSAGSHFAIYGIRG